MNRKHGPRNGQQHLTQIPPLHNLPNQTQLKLPRRLLHLTNNRTPLPPNFGHRLVITDLNRTLPTIETSSLELIVLGGG